MTNQPTTVEELGRQLAAKCERRIRLTIGALGKRALDNAFRAGRFLLIERSTYGGGLYLSLHRHPEAAASYWRRQECHWQPVALVDVLTGARFQPEATITFHPRERPGRRDDEAEDPMPTCRCGHFQDQHTPQHQCLSSGCPCDGWVAAPPKPVCDHCGKPVVPRLLDPYGSPEWDWAHPDPYGDLPWWGCGGGTGTIAQVNGSASVPGTGREVSQ